MSDKESDKRAYPQLRVVGLKEDDPSSESESFDKGKGKDYPGSTSESDWTPFGGILPTTESEKNRLVVCEEKLFKNMLILLNSLEYDFSERRENRRKVYQSRIQSAIGGGLGKSMRENEQVKFFKASEEEGLAYPDVMDIVERRQIAHDAFDPDKVAKNQCKRLILWDKSTQPPICLLHVFINTVYYAALFVVPHYGQIGLCRAHFVDTFYGGLGLMLLITLIVELEKAIRVCDIELT